MPSKQDHVRHDSAVALLLVDVINHFEFPQGSDLLKNALAMAPRLVRLKARARAENIPVVYVNDNFGQWHSNATELISYCSREDALGRRFIERLCPDEEDYFVLKPMHSAFFQTPLELLLRHLGAHSLILAGVATDSCILCTAHDGMMRDFQIYVAADCCAARGEREHEQALEHLRDISSVKVVNSSALRLAKLKSAGIRLK